MSKEQMIFKRYEVKFLMDAGQYQKLLPLLGEHMTPDEHGISLVQSLYYDTPDRRMIRRSIEKPLYKEKLRLRCYGVLEEGSGAPLFLELKKKYDHVVYKRRVEFREGEGLLPCRDGMSPLDRQIMREIGFTLSRYPRLEPACLISCDREAWYGRGDRDLRVTFDHNILWRDTDLDLHKGRYGVPILKESEILMEIKTGRGIPLWLTDFLSREKLYKRSFSKYGKAYEAQLADRQLADTQQADRGKVPATDLSPQQRTRDRKTENQMTAGGTIYGFHFSGAF